VPGDQAAGVTECMSQQVQSFLTTTIESAHITSNEINSVNICLFERK